jgi:hypothetical protein
MKPSSVHLKFPRRISVLEHVPEPRQVIRDVTPIVSAHSVRPSSHLAPLVPNKGRAGPRTYPRDKHRHFRYSIYMLQTWLDGAARSSRLSQGSTDPC